MFQYCPKCGKNRIEYKINRFNCPDCGFVYYHNTAAATGCVIESGGKILLLVRNREPSFGKLDLPGGFIDPGEGILEGLYRELKEELGWTPPVPPGVPLTAFFTLFASFPNVYLYKNIPYNTCDMFFTFSVPGLTEKDFSLEADETSGACFMTPDEVRPEDLASDSMRKAVEAFREFRMKR